VASRAGVNPQTLRYYERRGLLAAPSRSPGGYRAYPPKSMRRVRFIKRAQDLGFTLAEVESLLQLAEGGPDPCDRVRALAEEKIADLARRIADLQALQAVYPGWWRSANALGPQRECLILHELDTASTVDSPGVVR
jgi:MerR family transcriptional regulator, mercuric resistance operon regulatory protein